MYVCMYVFFNVDFNLKINVIVGDVRYKIWVYIVHVKFPAHIAKQMR